MRGSISGFVVRADDGKPVAAAKVQLEKEGQDRAESVRIGVQETDHAGWFAVYELTAGTWMVRVTGPRGGEGAVRVSVFDNATSELTIELNGLQRWLAATLHGGGSADVDLEVLPAAGSCSDPPPAGSRKVVGTGSVHGHVVWADNATPVADATIGVIHAAGPAPDIAALTGSDGAFALDGLPVGACVLRAVAPNGVSADAKFQVYEGVVTEGMIRIDR